jgi:hypothetical protein
MIYTPQGDNNSFINRKLEEFNKNVLSKTKKLISSYVTEDIQLINFWENNAIKLAIGLVKDPSNTYMQPGISLGAGDGAGGNRGLIYKDTNSLNIGFIGNLALGEGSTMKFLNGKIESSVPIQVNDAILGNFIINATNWNAKLEEASTKTILENPAKAWSIPKQNLKYEDYSKWDTVYTVIDPVDTKILTSKIKDASITTEKLANLAVDNSKLAALAVDAAKLAS